MYAELSELSMNEFSSHRGSIASRKSSVAKSSTAHVGHFSSKNMDLGKVFFRCYELFPEVHMYVKRCTCKDLNYWCILLKLRYKMMFE